GAEVVTVTDDAAPHPGMDFVLWSPPLRPDDDNGNDEDDGDDHDDSNDEDDGSDDDENTDDAAPIRRSASAEAAQIMAQLVASGVRTLLFVRSRAGAELAALSVKRALSRHAPELVDTVAAYRGGYLPEDRRELERAFHSGAL